MDNNEVVETEEVVAVSNISRTTFSKNLTQYIQTIIFSDWDR